jgi:hypothetical protein
MAKRNYFPGGSYGSHKFTVRTDNHPKPIYNETSGSYGLPFAGGSKKTGKKLRKSWR